MGLSFSSSSSGNVARIEDKGVKRLLVYLGIDDMSYLRPWADEDNCEFRSVAKPIPIEELLKGLSFSSSWISAAVDSAKAYGKAEESCVCVIFDDEAPHKGGDIVGGGFCIGRFEYDRHAFPLDLMDKHREAIEAVGLAPGVSHTLLSGLDELEKGRVHFWADPANTGALRRVTENAARSLQAVTDEDRRELEARINSLQSKDIALFRTVTTVRYRAWFTGDVLVALTVCSCLPGDMPTDRIRQICEPKPEGREGVYIIGGNRPNRMIIVEETRDWRALLDSLRAEWTDGCGWRNIGVMFSTREEALSLKSERLRKPYVMGWYSHPRGIFQP